MTVERFGKSLIALILAVCCWINAAAAADWTVKSSLDETVSFNDNPDLSVESPGFVFGSLSTLDLDITAKTRLSLLNLYGSVGYQTYIGPGKEATTGGLVPAVRAHYERQGKRLSLTADISYVVEVGTQGREFGEASTGDRQTIEASSSLTRKMDALNELSLAVRASNISFSGSGENDTPSNRIGGNVSWLHRATKRVDLNTAAGVDRYAFDNETNTVSSIFYLREDVTARLSNRLKIKAGTGATFLHDTKDDLFVVGNPRRSSNQLGALAEAGFEYQLKSTKFSGNAFYGLTPDGDGNLQDNLTFTLKAERDINDISHMVISAEYRLADSGSGNLDEKTFTLSPMYEREISRDWRMRLGYQLQIETDTVGTGVQHSAFISLRREFVLIP